MILKSDFFYELPEELIAQTPLADRSASRLLALDKKTGGLAHDGFKNILNYLNGGDCLVINDTKVIPARLTGVKATTGARIELLLLKRAEEHRWEALVKPGKRIADGDRVEFGGGILSAVQEADLGDGVRLMRFEHDGSFEEILDSLGDVPLPPYIKKTLAEKNRYQTVYAKNPGSAAAPTAGFHFTEEILRAAENSGVRIARITLHVGLGTFRPVKCEEITRHKMHAEYYEIGEPQAKIITDVKKSGGKVVCVGTTSCRAVESAADKNGSVRPGRGFTDIFIYPGYKFKITDALITNFHLPESTLLMLVSALAGRENILQAYSEAVKEKYRFFSFGDAMIIY